MSGWPGFKGSAEFGKIRARRRFGSAVTLRSREFDLGDSPEVTCEAPSDCPYLESDCTGIRRNVTRDVTHLATALPTGSRCRCRHGRAGSVDGRVGHVPIHSHGVVAHNADSCHTIQMDATVLLGPQGRIVIPAEVRAAMGLTPGDRLHLHVTGSQLVLERPQDAIVELRSLARQIPKSRSLVGELLAERRLAATAE